MDDNNDNKYEVVITSLKTVGFEVSKFKFDDLAQALHFNHQMRHTNRVIELTLYDFDGTIIRQWARYELVQDDITYANLKGWDGNLTKRWNSIPRRYLKGFDGMNMVMFSVDDKGYTEALIWMDGKFKRGYGIRKLPNLNIPIVDFEA